jgi:hypothetical protein
LVVMGEPLSPYLLPQPTLNSIFKLVLRWINFCNAYNELEMAAYCECSRLLERK